MARKASCASFSQQARKRPCRLPLRQTKNHPQVPAHDCSLPELSHLCCLFSLINSNPQVNNNQSLATKRSNLPFCLSNTLRASEGPGLTYVTPIFAARRHLLLASPTHPLPPDHTRDSAAAPFHQPNSISAANTRLSALPLASSSKQKQCTTR